MASPGSTSCPTAGPARPTCGDVAGRRCRGRRRWPRSGIGGRGRADAVAASDDAAGASVRGCSLPSPQRRSGDQCRGRLSSWGAPAERVRSWRRQPGSPAPGHLDHGERVRRQRKPGRQRARDLHRLRRRLSKRRSTAAERAAVHGHERPGLRHAADAATVRQHRQKTRDGHRDHRRAASRGRSPWSSTEPMTRRLLSPRSARSLAGGPLRARAEIAVLDQRPDASRSRPTASRTSFVYLSLKGRRRGRACRRSRCAGSCPTR